jgi:WD40 repeat protein
LILFSTNLDETKTTPSLESLQLATTQWSENFAVPNTPNSPFTRILANSSPSRAAIKKSQTFISLQSLQGHSGDIDSVSFSPDGLQLASGSKDNTIRIWADKQDRFELAQELTGHNDWVMSVAFSPNGQWLASGSKDKTVRIWADKQGRLELAQVLTGHNDWVKSVAFSRNGQWLASGSRDKTIRIWAEEEEV